MGTIYKITNKVNGKNYIGQTTRDVGQRFHEHMTQNSGCRLLRRAIKKYGKDVFKLEILYRDVPDRILDTIESEEIKRWNTLAPNGYNLESGGNQNKTSSPETRQKMSEAVKKLWEDPEYRYNQSKSMKKGWKNPNSRQKITQINKERWEDPEYRQKSKKSREDPEYRQKISDANKGRKHTAKSRQKMSEAHKGKKLTAETRKKMSQSKKGRKVSDETRRNISEAAKRGWIKRKQKQQAN